MAGDKTYITDQQGKQHRATRVHAVTPTDIVWSSNPNDYTVQVKIDGKWHRAVLTMDAGSSTFFDNINIDKALVTGADGKQHTALIVKPESTVTLSDIKTDTHGTIAGTTTGETAVSTYSENWSNIKWQDNVNVYKVLVTGSDGKVHTALLTTSAGGGGGVQVIVLGPSPLLLPDAIANSLQYVKAFGGTEQNGTPTPDTPVDIVSNNGVLKARHQSGLPWDYTLLEYIESTGTQWIDTDIYGTEHHGMEIKYSYPTLDGAYSGRLCGGRTGGTSTNAFAYIGTYIGTLTPANNTFYVTSNNGLSANLQPIDTNVHTASVNLSNNQKSYFDGQEIQGTGETTAYVHQFTTNLFRAYNGTSGWATPTRARIYLCKITNSGTLVRDFIPAKNSNNELGMYDLVSGQFFTNQGTGDFVAGSTVSDPVEIYTDGTVETINAHGKNLFDASTETENKFLNDSGTVVNNNNYAYSDFIPVVAGKTYTASLHKVSGAPSGTLRIHTYDSDGVWQQMIFSSTAAESATITIPAGISYVRLSWWKAEYATDRQFELGPTATTYEPYYNGGTATAEMLLSVGDYTDEQEIISGAVTRNIKALVLDGTEDWTASGNLFYAGIATDALEDTHSCYCTHFKGVATNASASYNNEIKVGTNATQTVNWTRVQMYPVVGTYSSVTVFKQWLADQYAAGTPVIVIYPLATATTESVAGQTLQVQAGNNTLEITQASLNGLELEAEYTKVA